MNGIVEKVKEDNVVQVVIDNMLMVKRKRLFWTPYATHCVDLMLEDFEKKILIHEETILKGRRITTYIYSKPSLISLVQYFRKRKRFGETIH
ncbi:hypothetical protein CR513_49969, partial [Mucuna pruriens]